MPISLIISYVFNYVLFRCTSFCILCECFYCTSLAAAVSALCASLSSHTYGICVHVTACICFMTKYMMMMMTTMRALKCSENVFVF